MGFNSTIISKKKKLKCGCFDYNFSHGLCKMHATIESTKKRVDKFEEEQVDESLSNLIADLDAIYSVYIRIKDADSKGMNECYTCGTKLHWTDLQCGHFEKRSHMSTRFEHWNTKPQCRTCNEFKDGNEVEFKKHLEDDRKGITEWLSELSKQIQKFTIEELKGMIADYRHKVQILKTKFK